VDERVETFVQTALSFQNFTAGNDVMFMMGTDFSYENAVTWFKNIDKIIHYVNLDGRVNALYSTPSIYARAKIASVKLPVRTDDMFPYADDAHAVWAGYFTSRPALKGTNAHGPCKSCHNWYLRVSLLICIACLVWQGYIRSTSSFHQTSRQLQLLSKPVPLPPSPLAPTVSTMQTPLLSSLHYLRIQCTLNPPHAYISIQAVWSPRIWARLTPCTCWKGPSAWRNTTMQSAALQSNMWPMTMRNASALVSLFVFALLWCFCCWLLMLSIYPLTKNVFKGGIFGLCV